MSKVSIMFWYLLQTKPNCHTLAEAHLNQQGYKVFLPLIARTSKRGSKFVNNLKPLFPGYLFLGTDLHNIPWKSINATRGVSKAVTLDGKYHAMDPAVIGEIMIRCSPNGVFQPMDKIVVGDRVKIEKGPLTDFFCKVDNISDSKRIWVLIDILQQQIRTSVSLAAVSKIN